MNEMVALFHQLACSAFAMQYGDPNEYKLQQALHSLTFTKLVEMGCSHRIMVLICDDYIKKQLHRLEAAS